MGIWTWFEAAMTKYPIGQMVAGTLLAGIIAWAAKKIYDRAKGEKPPPLVAAKFLTEGTASVIAGIDECVGRKTEKKAALGKIIKSSREKKVIAGASVYVTGPEGSGKTFFCQSLLKDLLGGNVYLGWINCKGSVSVYELIAENFSDSRFKHKNREQILSALKRIDRPCIFVFDNVKNEMPFGEFREIISSSAGKAALVLSGDIRKKPEGMFHVALSPLSGAKMRKIFTQKYKRIMGDEDFELGSIKPSEKQKIEKIIDSYANGIPALMAAFIRAYKDHYNRDWGGLLQTLSGTVRDESDERYLKYILGDVYRIRGISYHQQDALKKLSVFSAREHSRAVFDWFGIAGETVKSLLNTNWLTCEDGMWYSIDEQHLWVLEKLFSRDERLEALIGSANEYFEMNDKYAIKKFRWFASYAEDIIETAREYEKLNLSCLEEFTFTAASGYEFNIEDHNKAQKWLSYMNPSSRLMSYEKSRLSFQIQLKLCPDSVGKAEVESAYTAALDESELLFKHKQECDLLFDRDKEAAERDDRKLFLLGEYCNFLNHIKHYNESIKICEDFFASGFSFKTYNSCFLFERYVYALYEINPTKLQTLLSTVDLQDFLNFKRRSVGRTCFLFIKLYASLGDTQQAEQYKQRGVIISNELDGFYNKTIQHQLKLSDLEFAKYMRSSEQLRESLAKSLSDGDPAALYIEGKYQEIVVKDFGKALELYEKVADKGSLSAACAIGYLYYKGLGVEAPDFAEARKYWERGLTNRHGGSCYWLYELYSNDSFDGKDIEKAREFLEKAVSLGSERAKNELARITAA